MTNSKAEPANGDPGQNRQNIGKCRTVSSLQVMTKATVRTGQCEDTGAGWGQLALIEAIIIVQVELEQIHNSPLHGQDQCGVWHMS